MVIDTSVLLAILLGEPGSERLSRAMRAAPARYLSAASVVEAGLVAEGRFREGGRPMLERLAAHLEVEVVPFTEAHAFLALDGFGRFGKGRHPARLNFGDCFSYALAKSLGEPLLFVGDDFSRTDIAAAEY